MVYCKKLVDGTCEYTKGICFLKNPKTIEDYKVCPERFLGKDYSEMTQSEKALYNSLNNQNKLCEIESRLDKLSGAIGGVSDNGCADYAKFNSRLEFLEGLFRGEKKKRGILKRLFSRK